MDGPYKGCPDSQENTTWEAQAEQGKAMPKVGLYRKVGRKPRVRCVMIVNGW